MTDRPRVLDAGQHSAPSAHDASAPNSGVPATEELALRIRRVVADVLDLEPARLTRSADLVADLCVDSLAATELVLVLEDEFDLAIPDAERDPVLTYADLEDLVIRKVQGGSGPDRPGSVQALGPPTTRSDPPPSGRVDGHGSGGRVWPNAPVLKTGDPQGSGGSNPSRSADETAGQAR